MAANRFMSIRITGQTRRSAIEDIEEKSRSGDMTHDIQLVIGVVLGMGLPAAIALWWSGRDPE